MCVTLVVFKSRGIFQNEQKRIEMRAEMSMQDYQHQHQMCFLVTNLCCAVGNGNLPRAFHDLQVFSPAVWKWIKVFQNSNLLFH